jgi:hypothetical protein
MENETIPAKVSPNRPARHERTIGSRRPHTPSSDQLAIQWEGRERQYDPQHNTVISFGNGSPKPTKRPSPSFYN